MTSKLTGVRIGRVAHVPFFIATQLTAQIKYLSASGADVFVITSPGKELERLVSVDVRIEPIQMRRSISPWRDLVSLVKLIKCFRKCRLQIVHSATPKAGLLCALATKIAGTPIFIHSFSGQPWMDRKGPVRWIARGSDWLIGKLAALTLSDSDSQRELLISEGIVSPHKIKVIGKGSIAGVDLERFTRTRWDTSARLALRKSLGIPDSSVVILFVGRITRDKGIAELLSAFSMILSAGANADLLLVGPADNERGEGVAIAGNRIRHIGYTDTPETYMAIADIFCLPSYRESFGTAVMEAAAMGLPTVGTRISGLVDAVQDGVTGILVPKRDEHSLAVALRRLTDDSGLRKKLGEAARLRCVEHFDAREINRTLGDIYINLMDARVSPSYRN